MALNLEVSNKAPPLPIELCQDLMDAFEIVSNVFGGSALGQASMKAMQCLPLAWACLALKEAGKMAKDVRDREASRSYQEVALPGFIKLCHKAIEASDGALRFPAGWETKLYYTTLGGKGSKNTPARAPKTFMQSPGTAWTRFKVIKKEFTNRPSIWFDTNEVPDVELASGETGQQLVPQFHLAMYKLSDENVTTPTTWEETESSREQGSPCSGSGKPEAAEGVAPASGVGTGAGEVDGGGAGAGEVAGEGPGTGPGGRLCPLASAALRQACAGTRGAAPASDTDTPVPATGPTSTSNELAAMAAANIRQQDGEGAGSKPGGDDGEDEVVPTGYCYPYIIMAGAWGRREKCPTEWRYLTSSDGPSRRSKNGEGDAIVSEDSPIASEAAMDRVCPNGDPVSRRKAAKYREEQQKKAAKEAADKENAARALEEKENKRKRLEVLKTATQGITNVAASLAKMAELKQAEQQAEQQAAKRQKKIEALKLKLTLGLGDESKNKQALEELLDEEY